MKYEPICHLIPVNVDTIVWSKGRRIKSWIKCQLKVCPNSSIISPSLIYTVYLQSYYTDTYTISWVPIT